MTKRELWSRGLDRGQDKFGAIPPEIAKAAYPEYLGLPQGH